MPIVNGLNACFFSLNNTIGILRFGDGIFSLGCFSSKGLLLGRLFLAR